MILRKMPNLLGVFSWLGPLGRDLSTKFRKEIPSRNRVKKGQEIYCTWAKWARFVIFPVLCLLAYGDTALKSWFLLAFGGHKKGCDNDILRAVFPSIWAS